MTILVSGGGTGGHITPILAVASKLKIISPNCKIIYIGEKNGKFKHLIDGNSVIDDVYSIYAGKFRRYHGQNILISILDIKTFVMNIRDFFYTIIGILQAIIRIKKIQPDVVFLKGGYVGAPVGLAAAMMNIPIVTHDSDALPGLANRLVSKWAKAHATGMPLEYYNYSKETTHYVGVLVSDDYEYVDKVLQSSYKKEIGIPEKSSVLLITGGSLGANRLNVAVSKIIPELLSSYPELHIIHQVGKGNLKACETSSANKRVVCLEFMKSMYKYTGAADIVITRAGANTLAELGVQSKPCIVVPNPLLTGGHQLVNANYLSQNHAAEVVQEDNIDNKVYGLDATVRKLLNNDVLRNKLGKEINQLTKKDAALELAKLIIEIKE